MTILVFGGNGFIGTQTVRTLLKQGYKDIVVVNRGKTKDWNSGDLSQHVIHYRYNRKKPLNSCPTLQEYLQKHIQTPGGIIQAVLDFSAYDDEPIRTIMPYLKPHQPAAGCASVQHPFYVFISSDSVYEVCKDKIHEGPSVEADALRPLKEQDQYQLAEKDDYGDGKLKAEEYLHKQHLDGGLDYIILRLADVIGPRDTTDRWWQSQLYVQIATALREPIFLPKSLESKKLSFTYVNDVAHLVYNLITMTDVDLRLIKNDAYNIACVETVTMQGLYESIHAALFQSDITFRYTKDSECIPQIYPSVERGPIDVSKACDRLKFMTIVTPLKQAILDTVRFYDDVVVDNQYKTEKDDIYETMIEDFGSLYDLRKLKKILKTVLRLDA